MLGQFIHGNHISQVFNLCHGLLPLIDLLDGHFLLRALLHGLNDDALALAIAQDFVLLDLSGYRRLRLLNIKVVKQLCIIRD